MVVVFDFVFVFVDDGVNPFFRPCRNELLVMLVFVVEEGDLNGVPDFALKYGDL